MINLGGSFSLKKMLLEALCKRLDLASWEEVGLVWELYYGHKGGQLRTCSLW